MKWLLSLILLSVLLGLGSDVEVVAGESPAPALSRPAHFPLALPRSEVLFIDSTVDGYEQVITLLDDSNDGTRDLDIYVLDRNRDGVAQISETLSLTGA